VALKDSSQDTDWAYTETTKQKFSKDRPRGDHRAASMPSLPFRYQFSRCRSRQAADRETIETYRERGEKTRRARGPPAEAA